MNGSVKLSAAWIGALAIATLGCSGSPTTLSDGVDTSSGVNLAVSGNSYTVMVERDDAPDQPFEDCFVFFPDGRFIALGGLEGNWREIPRNLNLGGFWRANTTVVGTSDTIGWQGTDLLSRRLRGTGRASFDVTFSASGRVSNCGQVPTTPTPVPLNAAENFYSAE